MQREQPLLTIAIPTYNRSRSLGNLLKSLIPQIVSEKGVELLISDNASTDDTPTLIASAIDSGLLVTHIRNASNIGPDRNFLQCFERARGRFFWLLGDDDLVTPGGIQRVLSLLGDTDLDLVYCAPYVYQEDYLAELQNCTIRRSTEVTDDVIRFARLVNYHGDFIFISTLIVNKDKLLTYEHPSFETLLDTNVIQLSWAFTSLAHFQKGVFLQVGTVAGAANSPGGFDAAQVFGVNYGKAISIYLRRESRLAKVLLNDQLYLWFANNWVSIRQRSGLVDVQNTERLLRKYFGYNPRHWIAVVPLAKLPLGMAALWSKLLRGFGRLNRIARNL